MILLIGNSDYCDISYRSGNMASALGIFGADNQGGTFEIFLSMAAVRRNSNDFYRLKRKNIPP